MTLFVDLLLYINRSPALENMKNLLIYLFIYPASMFINRSPCDIFSRRSVIALPITKDRGASLINLPISLSNFIARRSEASREAPGRRAGKGKDTKNLLF